MNKIRLLILVGQLGRIWSRDIVQRKVLQSAAAVGFFILFVRKYKADDKDEFYFKNSDDLW